MFDIGFSEVLLVAVIALLVLGPQRLPTAARFTGLWVRRARAQWHSVKAELERDLATEQLQRSLQEGREALREADAGLRRAGDEVQRELHDSGEANPAPPSTASQPPPPTPSGHHDDDRR